MEEEVLQLYVGYLKKMIAMRGRMEYKNVVELMEQGLTVCKDGNIGIVRSPMWFEPSEKKSSSEEIVKRALDFTLGWHLESVTQGDYPLTMKDSVGARLRSFTLSRR
ncbi:hypothetical protein Bca52824_086617 [Brassica carinata]|uniref:thioglucosidase n=1 Tax=Brassica carinata TaxID=52824 RepID=A0A8X7TME3_BRACI|nr:hypothetical protein Bca52824_086617 [Brassica carinata]